MAENDKLKLKLKTKLDRKIEVFPTTVQLVTTLIISVGILGALLFADWSQYSKAHAVAEAAKAAKASYFATGRIPKLTEYETNIRHAAILRSVVGSLETRDGTASKLARSTELSLSPRLAEIYPKLTEDEKKYLPASLSDWKLSRLITEMPATEAQKLISELYGDVKEKEAQRSASSAQPAEPASSETTQANQDLAPGASPPDGATTQPETAQTGQESAAGVTSGQIQDMFDNTDNVGGPTGP